jgi:hypothetical protein
MLDGSSGNTLFPRAGALDAPSLASLGVVLAANHVGLVNAIRTNSGRRAASERDVIVWPLGVGRACFNTLAQGRELVRWRIALVHRSVASSAGHEKAGPIWSSYSSRNARRRP